MPLTLNAQQQADIVAVEVPLTVTQTPGNTNNGSATWTYSLADSNFDFLAAGEMLTLTYTATVDDGHGGVVTQPFTVTITGTNDAPAIADDQQRASPSCRTAQRPTVGDAGYGVGHDQLHRCRPDRPAGGERGLHLVQLYRRRRITR